jgi:aspartyl/glutamyl-tRNA(Asn/Gln) amidotransferase C subunit
MISKEEVRHIAKLARLELSNKEIEKMQKDLSEILDYFDLLKKAPEPEESEDNFSQGLKATREDIAVSSHDIADELIGSAPDKKDDYIKVKSIL